MSGHHISSAKFLWGIGIALFFLTFVTVAVTWIQIPEPWNIVVAIGIAVVKALLVVLFFMNLYWDSKFNSLLFIFSLIFFGLMIGITLLDTLFRNDPTPLF
ncbi:cytochrome C oxidase subunit IV family protein [Rhodohalobacter halophilus]|uniref:cytochrome C oxidase subunit IV family protein n=1 Tax=Rhodohalobacter halophilus TaxID=1812810 RepID=UPI00083F8CF7|nr:cytochrome C oxidase subunit IV family protein [Rhodohalobacter halophilus]